MTRLSEGNVNPGDLKRLLFTIGPGDARHSEYHSALPVPTFTVVVADPPWRYGFFRSRSRAVDTHYESASLQDICDLGAKLPLTKDAVLFLWATAPKLTEALLVLHAWGFSYKTCAVWDKQKLGMGYWFRGQHELLLVGTRGKAKPPAPALRRSSVFRSPRGEHSQKPEEVQDWVDQAFPEAAKLELYATRARPGWTCLGAALGTRL